MAATTLRRRTAPRTAAALDVTLRRPRASPVDGRTQDVGPSGLRVACRRPLRVDEHLEFELVMADGTRVAGQAHVVREHGYGVYALRFDALAPADGERLMALVATA